MILRTLARAAPLVALALPLSCSSDGVAAPAGPGGPGAGGPDRGGRVRFAVATRAVAAPALNAALAPNFASRACSPTLSASGGATTITCGDDVVTLHKVSVVLREIELERAGVVTCDAVAGNDDCEEIELGPMRFDLPLGVTAVASVVTVQGIPAGMYDELEFEIHRPSLTRHADFVRDNPDLVGASIRVEGTFSQGGAAPVPFTFMSDLEEDEEEDIALQVTENGTAGVTLNLDVASWFMVNGRLVNPATANHDGPNEDDVTDNVEAGFAAFQDDNQDGMPDRT